MGLPPRATQTFMGDDVTTKKRYGFDDHPEHRDQLQPWAQKWIANALSTEPADRDRMTTAMTGLYEAANLEPPTRYAFVKSPMTAAIAGTVAAGVWWLRENPGKHRGLFGQPVSEAELMAAIPVACRLAVEAGMAALRGEPAPVRAATGDATGAATDAVINFLLRCVPNWWRMHNAGSDWSGWAAYLSFFHHIAKLDLPIYDKWQHYENATLYGASRMMHKRFWIVSDRHTSIHMDPQNRLHCEDGPARSWGDGWAIWSWHGTRVPADMIETGWEVERIFAERNAEIRRCAIEKHGWDRLTDALTLVSECDDPGNHGQTIALYDLPEAIADMYEQPARILLCTNGTPETDGHRRRFGLPVPAGHTDPVAAAAALYDWPTDVYRQLARRA